MPALSRPAHCCPALVPGLQIPQPPLGFFHPAPLEIHSDFSSGPGSRWASLLIFSQVILGGRICHLHNERKMNLSSEPVGPAEASRTAGAVGGEGKGGRAHLATPCQAWPDRSVSSPLWSRGKLRHRELERVAQGATAAEGQSWAGSLAAPTQHPVNAGEVGLMGFKSQRPKEIGPMVCPGPPPFHRWRLRPSGEQRLAQDTQRGLEGQSLELRAPAPRQPPSSVWESPGMGTWQASARLQPKGPDHTSPPLHPFPPSLPPQNHGLCNPSSDWLVEGQPAHPGPQFPQGNWAPLLGPLGGLAGRAWQGAGAAEAASPTRRLQSELSVCLPLARCLCFPPPPPPSPLLTRGPLPQLRAVKMIKTPCQSGREQRRQREPRGHFSSHWEIQGPPAGLASPPTSSTPPSFSPPAPSRPC